MPDNPGKAAWEADNVIQVAIKINRNKDPELFAMLKSAESRSGLIREILREAAKKPRP